VKEKTKGKTVSIYLTEKQRLEVENLIVNEKLKPSEAIKKALVQELAPAEITLSPIPKEEIIAAIDTKLESLKTDLKALLEAQNKRLQDVEDLGVATSSSMLSWWAKRKWRTEFKNFLKKRKG
jgi:hypothetical protein